MTATKKRATACALLAAVLYALNAPFSKLLLGQVPPTAMAALLYLGAGIGVFLLRLVRLWEPDALRPVLWRLCGARPRPSL